MAYQISSSIVNVDVTLLSKYVQLPPASTVIGISFLIRDLSGNSGFPNVVNISTTGLDTIDYANSGTFLGTNFQSIRLIAQSTTNYAILMQANNFTWPTS